MVLYIIKTAKVIFQIKKYENYLLLYFRLRFSNSELANNVVYRGNITFYKVKSEFRC